MKQVALWQFNLATFLVTQILLGVEGWFAWAISALLAWYMTRNQPRGEKDYKIAGGVWIFLVFIQYLGRAA
jgi:hypothetical protein